MREEEWKVDVPTIGGVYDNRLAGVVFYLSGLGRPLNSKADDLESDRCWFKRAWTLQEMNEDHEVIIGGDTGDKELKAKYESLLWSLKHTGRTYAVLSQMQKRVSTKSVDKVVGLAYLLRLDFMPAYEKAVRGECVDGTGSRGRGLVSSGAAIPVSQTWGRKQILETIVEAGHVGELPIRNPLLYRWTYETNVDSYPSEHAYVIESAFCARTVQGRLARAGSTGRGQC